jgi:hypothetical protein
VESRDFFEPGGSQKTITLLKEVSGDYPNTSSEVLNVIKSGLTMCKIITKSENNKGVYHNLFHVGP